MAALIPGVKTKVGRCMTASSFFFLFSFRCFFADVIKRSLEEGGGGYVFVADDPDLRVEVVLKMIPLGPEGSKKRTSHEKMIRREIEIGLIIAKKSRYLVSYAETFDWVDYFCIKMEYCRLGDLQQQFDSGRVFKEEAYLMPLFFMTF
jgi:serine/threonine protein kinase